MGRGNTSYRRGEEVGVGRGGGGILELQKGRKRVRGGRGAERSGE